MRLQKYISEEVENSIRNHWDLVNKKLSKKYDIKDKDIKFARKQLAKKHKVKENDLKFEFIWEVLEGTVMLTFNITDENHKNFKSSVNYRWLPIEKRGV